MHVITGLLLAKANWGMETTVSTVHLWIKGFAKLIFINTKCNTSI
jgi:hypothetical protein